MMGKWVYVQCYATEPREIVHVSKGLVPNSSFPSPAFAEAIVEADDYGGAIAAGQKLRKAGDKRLQEGKDSLMNDHVVEIPENVFGYRIVGNWMKEAEAEIEDRLQQSFPFLHAHLNGIAEIIARHCPATLDKEYVGHKVKDDPDADLMERALSVIKESDGADEHRELIEELEVTLRDRPTGAHSLEESLQDLADIQEELSRLMSRLRSVEDELAAIKMRIAPVVP